MGFGILAFVNAGKTRTSIDRSNKCPTPDLIQFQAAGRIVEAAPNTSACSGLGSCHRQLHPVKHGGPPCAGAAEGDAGGKTKTNQPEGPLTRWPLAVANCASRDGCWRQRRSAS